MRDASLAKDLDIRQMGLTLLKVPVDDGWLAPSALGDDLSVEVTDLAEGSLDACAGLAIMRFEGPLVTLRHLPSWRSSPEHGSRKRLLQGFLDERFRGGLW